MGETHGASAMARSTVSPVDSFPTALVAWSAVAVLLVLGCVAFLDRQIISLLVGMLKTDLKITDSQIGLLQGPAFGLLYSIAGLPLGLAVDRFPRRAVIFFGVFFWALAACASGLAHSFGALFAARVGVGLGEAALAPAIGSMLSDLFPKKRLALAFSVVATGALLGSAIALIVGGAVITLAAHGLNMPVVGHLRAWQVAFIVTGAPGLALAFAIFLIPEPRRHGVNALADGRESAWSDVFAFLRANAAFFSLYASGFACMMIVVYGVLAWLPSVLHRSYGWSTAQIGLRLGLFVAAFGVSGQLSNGAVVDRFFGRGMLDAHARYYVGGAIVIAVFSVAAPFARDPWIYLAVMAPVHFLLNFGGVSSAGYQIVTPNAVKGRVAALMGMFLNLIGLTVGPSIVAAFTDFVFHDDAKVGLSLALSSAIFASLASVLFWLALKPMRAAVARAGV